MTSPFSYTSPVVSVEALKHSIAYKLMFVVGKDPSIATQHDWLNATLFAVRDRIVERWLRSTRAQFSQDVRQVSAGTLPKRPWNRASRSLSQQGHRKRWKTSSDDSQKLRSQCTLTLRTTPVWPPLSRRASRFPAVSTAANAWSAAFAFSMTV